MNPAEKTRLVVRSLAGKKAQDMVVLDLRGLTIIADFFVIATGASAVNIRAIVEGLLETMRKHGVKGVRPEGLEDLSWVLVDWGDVVVHIFNAEQRDFYQLERLWGHAARVPLPEDVMA